MNADDKVQPTLTTEELQGHAEAESPRCRESCEDFDAAKAALDQVDVNSLFRLYEKAVREHNKMEDLVFQVARFNLQRKDGADVPTRRTPAESESTIAAMEKVALAAIELARVVCAANDNNAP